MMNEMMKYFKAHPTYSSTVHFVIGLGVGILVTYPFIGSHPVRWGLFFLVIGVLAHIYPLFAKK